MSAPCTICGGPVAPKKKGKSGPLATLCSAVCRSEAARRRRVESNIRRKARYASDASYRETERTYHRERQRRKAETDPEFRARRDQLHRKWLASNRDRVAEHERRRKAHPLKRTRQRVQNLRSYALTLFDFNAKLSSQGGACAICRRTEPRGKGGWHLDHDHSVDARDPRGHRGLLCHPCNTALGAFKDSPEILRAAAAYLTRHGAP